MLKIVGGKMSTENSSSHQELTSVIYGNNLIQLFPPKLLRSSRYSIIRHQLNKGVVFMRSHWSDGIKNKRYIMVTQHRLINTSKDSPTKHRTRMQP